MMPNRVTHTKNASRPKPKRILLVDDRDDCRITTKWFLNNFGYAVDSVPNAERALILFDPGVHHVVITDNRMPGMSGSEMAQTLKLRSPATPIIMYTGQPPEDISNLDVVLQRPTHLLALKEAVDKLVGEVAHLPA
jgi:DNA-binding response OmpR family regulator